MPTAATLKTKQFDNLGEVTACSRQAGLTAARRAREAVSETTTATVDSLVAYTEVAQQMLGELTALTLSGAKDLYQLQTDASQSAFDALGDSLGKDLAEAPAVVAWQKMVKAGAEALDKLAAQVKASVEEGNEKIRDAVDTVAVQVKDHNAKLATAVANLEKAAAEA